MRACLRTDLASTLPGGKVQLLSQVVALQQGDDGEWRVGVRKNDLHGGHATDIIKVCCLKAFFFLL